MTDTAALQRQIAAAEAKAADARAKLEAEQARHAAEANVREKEWDNRVVGNAKATDERLGLEEVAAFRDFEATLLDSDVGRAWVKFRAAWWRRYNHVASVGNSASRSGQTAPNMVRNYRDPRLFEDMVGILERAAKNTALDEVDATEEQRHAYVDRGEGQVIAHEDAAPPERNEAIAHADDCLGDRIETYAATTTDGGSVTVTRCLHCGATDQPDPPPDDPPTSKFF